MVLDPSGGKDGRVKVESSAWFGLLPSVLVQPYNELRCTEGAREKRICISGFVFDLFQHPQLAGGHNFCRNPGNEKDEPWCFVDRNRVRKESCDIPKCGEHSELFKCHSLTQLTHVLYPFINRGCNFSEFARLGDNFDPVHHYPTANRMYCSCYVRCL